MRWLVSPGRAKLAYSTPRFMSFLINVNLDCPIKGQLTSRGSGAATLSSNIDGPEGAPSRAGVRRLVTENARTSGIHLLWRPNFVRLGPAGEFALRSASTGQPHAPFSGSVSLRGRS